ncbi:MAG: hypothetical protein E7135_07090 [Rikenellaceae bacterium]|nr:hypothetical protein [Rikenellaceae bacterium]
MFKRRTITLTAIVGITISAFAFADIDKPDGLGLQNNKEYQQLLAESERLRMEEDSLRNLISETRANMHTYIDTLTTEPSRDFINKYNSRIVELEEEIFNINTRQGVVASRINAYELGAMEDFFKDHVFKRLDNSNDNATAEGEEIAATTEQQQSTDDATTAPDAIEGVDDSSEHVAEKLYTRSSKLIDNEPFVKALSADDLRELHSAHESISQIDGLVQEYLKQYNALRKLIAAYEDATEQQTADPIYEQIATQIGYLDTLNTEISDKWNYILDTKYYAYGLVIETSRNKELLERLDSDINTMLQHCAENDNLYASNGVMRYALGHTAIIDFEIIMASEFGLTEAGDVLRALREAMVTPTYQLSPIDMPERRLFIDYQSITFGRTNYYNDANPLPQLKVYEQGTIYRILLGIFKSRQPMTLFKGVQPLYIDKDSEGMNHYYAGGFATLEEAEAAQRLLFDKGFKGPEICVWRDGKMVNLTADDDTPSDKRTIEAGATRYMLRVADADMSDALREYLKEHHPSKVITLTNTGYVIGSFDNHDEVTRLFITIGDEFGIDLEIMEVEIQ